MFMFTKTGSNLTYHEYSYTSVDLTIQSFGLTRLHDKLKTWYPTTALSLASKLCRFVTYLEGLLPIKTHEPFTTWSREFMWQTRTVISLYLHYHVPINTKLWRVVTYLERVLPKKTSIWTNNHAVLQDLTTKNIVSLLLQCLWQPNLVGGFYP